MDVEPDIPLVALFRLSRVEAHADLELEPGGPADGRERPLRVPRRPERGIGAAECDEDCVALRVDLGPAVHPGGLADHRAMERERVPVRGAEGVQGRGRALHVGEEQGHGPRGERAHRSSVGRMRVVVLVADAPCETLLS